MRLVEIFLPIYNNQGQPFPRILFDHVRENLTAQFGGVTAFVRSPAIGVWENDKGAVCHDDIVLFEVMVDAVDRAWWKTYRLSLERQFNQEALLIRVTKVDLL